MDTIVYLDCCRGNTDCSYEIKKYQLQDYQLIRVTVREQLLPEKPILLGFSLRRWRLERKYFRMGERLRWELAPLLDENGGNFLVYADDVPGQRRVRELLPLPEFDGWLEPEWVRRLLPCAVHTHFIVLGDCPGIREILCELAPRMKSLLWIAPDVSDRELLEDFAEDFYQEYGLAINLRFVPAGGNYGQIRIDSGQYHEPVNVLDFTRGKYIPTFCPPEGSVWLSMASVGDRERRIRARGLKVTTLSLKKQWEILDTATKNRYNTLD